MLIPSVNRYESHIRPFSFTCAHKFLPISCETNTFNSFGAGNSHIQHARMVKVEASPCADTLSFAICITIWKQIVSLLCWPPFCPPYNFEKLANMWSSSLKTTVQLDFQRKLKSRETDTSHSWHYKPRSEIHWRKALILPVLNLQQATFGSKLT